MKIARMKLKNYTLLVNPIIDLDRPVEMTIKKGEEIAYKYHNVHGDLKSSIYATNLP